MIILTGSPATWDVPTAGSAVAIGVFDGIHLGHHRVLDGLGAGGSGLWKVALTFGTHPAALLSSGGAPTPLTTLVRRLELLEQAGMDAVAVLEFDDDLRNLSPSEFVVRYLVEGLHAHLVIVGVGFRFGRDADGDVHTLERFGELHGFAVETVPILGSDGREIRSTAIRRALSRGDVGSAAEMLGRPHEVDGTIVPGDGRGRQIGIPTANLELDAPVAVPARGVYIVSVTVDGAEYPAVANVGVRPTFDGSVEIVEVHILDFDRDLYDTTMRVRFLSRLRDERRFGSVAELIEQIGRDVAAAREHFAAVVSEQHDPGSPARRS